MTSDPPGDKYSIQQGRLVIKKLELADTKTYVCRAAIIGTEESETYNIKFTAVPVPPEFNSKTEQHSVIGEDGVVDCNVTSKPAPVVIWLFENGDEIPDGESRFDF